MGNKLNRDLNGVNEREGLRVGAAQYEDEPIEEELTTNRV